MHQCFYKKDVQYFIALWTSYMHFNEDRFLRQFKQVEFEWVLREEVHAILKQLRKILVECAHLFPVPLYANEGKKTENYIMNVAPEKLRAIVTLTGDSITHAVSLTHIYK